MDTVSYELSIPAQRALRVFPDDQLDAVKDTLDAVLTVPPESLDRAAKREGIEVKRLEGQRYTLRFEVPGVVALGFKERWGEPKHHTQSIQFQVEYEPGEDDKHPAHYLVVDVARAAEARAT